MKKPTHIRIHMLQEDNDTCYKQCLIHRDKSFTPYNNCVEYEDYYEIAMHSWYMRICKETLEITSNFNDVAVFEKMEDRYAVVY